MGKIMLNGKQYGVGGITDADDVKYTDSQTVKGALDELKSGLNNLFLWKQYSYAYSIPANGTLTIKANDFGVSGVTGYTGVSFMQIVTGNTGALMRAFYANSTGTDNMLILNNVTSASITGTARVTILFVNNSSLDAL